MDNRGQTTFEYLLLVGGVVVLGVLVIYMLTSSVRSSARDVNRTVSNATGALTNKAQNYINYIQDINDI
ncbi:MAG: class III signal peptide-containing protein [Candidatus Diapherotrites archaeon]|nr:class III signal peptide-containing protein [Candidatus Diapherotrites archaeon]